MRVTCHTIAEFLECLEERPALFQDTVRVSIYRNPSGDSPVYDVTIQASAIVLADQESHYLLEAGENCGVDYEDGEPEKKGTEVAEAHKTAIKRFAEMAGCNVKPGILDF